jgi:hypothetical protein
MDVAAERELGGERQVGRLLLRREGGRMVRGRVGAYLAEMDQFVAVFDNGAVLVLDWDGLEGLVPLLPYAKQRESKPKETKEVQAATRGGVSRAKELAARTLRSLLITLVEANNSVDTDHKQNVLRGLKDRSLTVHGLADCYNRQMSDHVCCCSMRRHSGGSPSVEADR